MKTIKLPIMNQIDITDEMKIYSSSVRFCFNRFKDGLTEKEIRVLTKDKFKIGSWLVQCSIKEAEQIFKTKKDQKVVFGGRKNLKDYVKKKITKEQYKQRKLVAVCSQGEKLRQGNRKFTLNIVQKNSLVFKLNRKKHVEIQLPHLRKNIRKELYRLEELVKQKKVAYMVKLSNSFIYISFEEKELREEVNYKLNPRRVLGIDLNPNYIGYSILEFDSKDSFKVIHKELIEFKELTDNSGKASNHVKSIYKQNKLQHEQLETVKYIAEKAKEYRCQKVVIEELNIRDSDKKKGRNFNRLCNNKWNRNLIVNACKKHCGIYNIEVVEVNPAYSSFVGNINYGGDTTPDAVASSIEIGRRGYKKFSKGWFYPVIKNTDNLKKLWKQDLDWSSLSWVELNKQAKESKLRYRFSLDRNSEFSRLFSYKSQIKLYRFR